jgi:hypothetical protein
MKIGKFYFGLNALYGRRSPAQLMDITQVASLLRHARDIDCPLAAVELGNELGLAPPALHTAIDDAPRVLPAVLAFDIGRVSGVLKALYNASAPIMVGADWQGSWQGQVLANTTELAEVPLSLLHRPVHQRLLPEILLSRIVQATTHIYAQSECFASVNSFHTY